MKTSYRWWLFLFAVFSTCYTGPAVSAVEKTETKISQEKARGKVLMLLSGEWVSRSLYVATKLEIADHLHDGP